MKLFEIFGKKYSDFFLRFLQNIPLITSDNKLNLILEFFNTIFSIILIFYVPLNVSFKIWDIYQDDQIFEIFFFYFPLVVYSINILVDFNKEFYYRGSLITNKFLIYEHYLLNGFFLDIINIIIFIYAKNSNFQIFFVLKIMNVQNSIKNFTQHLYFSEKFEGFSILI